MSHINFSEFRANMAAHMEKLEQDRDQLVVTRDHGEPMVVMPLKDLRSIEETLHLLGNPVNAARLAESIRQLEEGKVVEVDPRTMKPLR